MYNIHGVYRAILLPQFLIGLLGFVLNGLLGCLATAQTLRDSVPTIYQNISIDRYAQWYVSTKIGGIDRYDTQFQKNLFFSPQKPATVTLLEARNPLQVFAFYRDFQEYTLFDRFLQPIKTQSFKDTPIQLARLACPATDGQVWVIDEGDFSLQKYNPERNEISLKIALSLIFTAPVYDICFMAEYQNQLFVVDRETGIFVFDNFGNFRYHIAQTGINTCSFWADELYYCANNTVFVQHLYTGTHKEIALPPYWEAQMIVATAQSAVVIGRKLYWFTY